MSPKQEGTPPRRGLTLPQAVRGVGWGLLQPAERVRPPRGDPCKDAGAAVEGKNSLWLWQCCQLSAGAQSPAVPWPPRPPSAPFGGQTHLQNAGSCARLCTVPCELTAVPWCPGGALGLVGTLGGGALVSLQHAEASPSAQALGTAVPLVTIPGEDVGTGVRGEQGPCPMSLAHQEHLPGLND